MRKSIYFLTISILISASLFSQIKHNKFATRIMFDQFNTSDFWHTEITEIKDNSGYFLSNRKDGAGFNPSIVKLDVDGNIVFDTIYDFLPNNFGGFTNFRNAVTKTDNHTVLYSAGHLQSQMALAAPYLLNIDTVGNINWHVGVYHDSLDLEVKKLIPTQDGGYLVAGTLYDWMNLIYVPSGFAIKLDNMGTMQWHNFYADKDSMEIHFNDVIETPDGGFLFVGDAPNFQGGAKPPVPGNSDILINLVRTDNLGNIIWSKAMNLDYPINPQYGFGDFSLAMLNDTNAFISYSVFDTTNGGNDKFAITSINVNNGVNNWTKLYNISSGDAINIKKSIASNKGEIIITASDFNASTGVVFGLDANGNYLHSKRFTYWNHSNFPYNTINTLDGGFAHVSQVDGDEVLVVKTDKLFDPSCSDIDSSYGGLISTQIADSSFFGVIDTTYTNANLMTTSLPIGSPQVTSADDSLICSCSNQITGFVMDGITPVNNAHVFLFRKGVVPKPWSPIDSIHTDVTGAYTFNYVPTDSFLVKVEPDPIFNPNSMISYHKHQDTCYKWESAGVFHVHCDSGSVTKDVTLITPPPLTGGSALNGYIFESTGSFSKAPGDPIPGIDITVEQSPGGIVGGSTSSTNGYYDLQNINSNATYIISVDFPGLPHDSIWTVAINLNDSTLDSLNFYIDSTGIYIIDGGITGVDLVDNQQLEIDVYPNPSNNNFSLEISALKPENIHLEIMNELGQTIFSNTENLISGENKITLNTENYSQGLYLLKVKQGNLIYFKKLIKQ